MNYLWEGKMRKVYADYDEEGVYVYQAFRPKIVQVAVEKGTFGKGFGLDRITWIKPSLAWTLQRSKYATKNRMTAIARIKLSHSAWLEILTNSIQTQFDECLYSDEDEWQSKLNKSDIIHQWDPERAHTGIKLNRAAIQIGLRGQAIRDYVDKWIIAVEDLTPLAHEIGKAAKNKQPLPVNIPEEKEYPLENKLQNLLGCR